MTYDIMQQKRGFDLQGISHSVKVALECKDTNWMCSEDMLIEISPEVAEMLLFCRLGSHMNFSIRLEFEMQHLRFLWSNKTRHRLPSNDTKKS
jgi:hypothetical protein